MDGNDVVGSLKYSVGSKTTFNHETAIARDKTITINTPATGEQTKLGATQFFSLSDDWIGSLGYSLVSCVPKNSSSGSALPEEIRAGDFGNYFDAVCLDGRSVVARWKAERAANGAVNLVLTYTTNTGGQSADDVETYTFDATGNLEAVSIEGTISSKSGLVQLDVSGPLSATSP